MSEPQTLGRITLGAVEWNSLAAGMAGTDAMMKAAYLELEQSFPYPPGRWFTLVSGEAAAVELAVEAGRAAAPEALRDSVAIIDVSPDVVRAMARAQEIGYLVDAGVVECNTLVAAIAAADAAVKASSATLLQVRLLGDFGGKALVVLAADGDPLTRAMDAARTEAEKHHALIDARTLVDPHPAVKEKVIENR